MELRSSRSRSRTPFEGDLVQNEVSKVTRVTRSSTYRSYETVSKDEVSSQSESTVTAGRLRQRSKAKQIKYHTSDYSSEDGGENEVSSTHVERQNVSNEVLEHSRRQNGIGTPALSLYRRAKEYWNEYPKTDYTYSTHSRDRIVLAPGVVNMPNMSRKPIHESTPIMQFADRQTNTENEHHTMAPTVLFGINNNNHHQHESYKYRRTTVRSTSTVIVTRIFSFMQTIVTIFSSLVYRVGSKPHRAVVATTSWLHRGASRLMQIDTWLLRKLQKHNKMKTVAGLCLIPLLLLGGWWLISALSQYRSDGAIEEPPAAPQVVPSAPQQTDSPEIVEKIIKIQLDDSGVNLHRLTDKQLHQLATKLRSELNSNLDEEAIIALISQNLKYDGHSQQNNDNELPKSVLQKRGSDEEIMNKLHLEIKELKDRLDNIGSSGDLKAEIEKLRVQLGGLRQESAASYLKLTHEMRKCCRRSFIPVDGYISVMLKRLLEQEKDDIAAWLNTIFVAKNDLESRLNNATSQLREEYNSLVENSGQRIMNEVAQKINLKIKREVTGGLPNDDYIKGIVKEVLDIYDADRTGLVDYAAEPSGGQIISTRCTERYSQSSAVVSYFGIPLWFLTHSERLVITPGKKIPGECWCFQNFPGYLVIQLSENISVEAFSFEHISPKLDPSGQISSAPKKFSVYGLTSEHDKDPVLIGEYEFQREGEPLQYFAAQRVNSVFNMIELRINSNQGNPNYTCLYRFRVHGKPLT